MADIVVPFLEVGEDFGAAGGSRNTVCHPRSIVCSFLWLSMCSAISVGVHVYLGDGSSGDQGEEEAMMVPYSRNEISSSD